MIGHDIETFPSSTKSWTAGDVVNFSSRDVDGLLDGIRGDVPPENYIPIRHLYRLLEFDENHPFRWHLEDKLIQALLLEYFSSGSVPITSGLTSYVARCASLSDESLWEILNTLYVKRARGSNACPDNAAETRRAFDDLRERDKRALPGSPTEEEWIVQERLAIAEEYRVHTIEDSVIPDLTFYRHSTRPLRTGRETVNHFVESVIRRCPAAFFANSICGWDVCLTRDQSFKVIEINFGGFHPTIERGFQCSGFFVREAWGPYLIARLLRFVERKYSLAISHDPVLGKASYVACLYSWILQWRSLLDIVDLTRDLVSLRNESNIATVSEEVLFEFAPAAAVFDGMLKRLQQVSNMLD
jgi:hypothetical protein